MPAATVAEDRCEDCSHPVPIPELVATVEGERLCRGCVAALAPCDSCGYHARERRRTVSDTWLCSECWIDWPRCDDWQDYTREITALIGGRDVCTGCRAHYLTCDACAAYAVDINAVDSGQQVCSECAAENYHECADCRTLIPLGEAYCRSCPSPSRSNPHLFDSDYKPEPVFHGRGPLFLGMELEVKTPRSVLDEAVDLAVDHLGDLGYLKDERSISCGFEIVTHPMSHLFARQHFPWPLLRQLDTLGAFTDDGVGIHIHLSRSGFSGPAHIYRWLKFVYRNEEQITTLARRRSIEWAAFDSEARARAAEDAHGTRDEDVFVSRYRAVNVRPANTFELRVFASSLCPREVQAAMAFADASAEYTRRLTTAQIARHRGWEWRAFTTWVARRRPAYAPLITEMKTLRCAS